MRPDLLYMVDDLRRTAAEDSQLARWDREDCQTTESRLSETIDGHARAYLLKRLDKLRKRSISGQARAARHYAMARTILGID